MTRPHDPASANAALLRAQAFMTPSPVPSVDPSSTTRISRGAGRLIASRRLMTARTVRTSL